MIEAWLRVSLTTRSPGPARADISPTFAAYPLVKTRAAGCPTSSAAASSSLAWMGRSPVTRREAPAPEASGGACSAASPR